MQVRRRTRDTAAFPLATLLGGLALFEGVQDGGFWRSDALVMAIAAAVILVAHLLLAGTDRRGAAVVLSLLLLAGWWAIRAAGTGLWGNFLPLGASLLAFAAAFAVVRTLTPAQRETAALAVGALGAAGSAAGFVGLIWRLSPLAMPAQHLWRLSTTLTYADAAGLVSAICLLLSLSCTPRLPLARVVVTLCAAGLVASQSRGAYLAWICACALVPLWRYRLFLVPLMCGAALGVVAVATSSWAHAVPVLGVAVVGALTLSFGWPPTDGVPSGRRRWRTRAVVISVVALALVGAVALTHHEIGLRVLAPSDQDRSVEWATAFHQFRSSPFIGVGPDRLLRFHAVDGNLAHFAHNEYLQIMADGGVVGLALLMLVAVTLVRAVRRRDVVASCAVGGLVCLAVGGAFDFDWHLPVVGLIGGCVAGLAAADHRHRAPVSAAARG